MYRNTTAYWVTGIYACSCFVSPVIVSELCTQMLVIPMNQSVSFLLTIQYEHPNRINIDECFRQEIQPIRNCDFKANQGSNRRFCDRLYIGTAVGHAAGVYPQISEWKHLLDTIAHRRNVRGGYSSAVSLFLCTRISIIPICICYLSDGIWAWSALAKRWVKK